MVSCAVFGNSFLSCRAISSSSTSAFPVTISKLAFPHSFASSAASPNNNSNPSPSPSVHDDSLRLLQWDELCDSVASFARTSLGRHATRAKLWSLNQSYEDSLRLLDETNAAVEMLKHGRCSLDFIAVDTLLVKSALQHARRGSPLDGKEALAVVSLLHSAETLQLNLKSDIKEDASWYKRFMPLSQLIMQLVLNPSLVKLIQQVIDEDGSVKDSASSALKKSRDQVRMLERKLYQLMDSLVRKEADEASSLEVSNIDGRWCIRSRVRQANSFKGLLLSSGSTTGSIVEPLSAVPLNDELQQARALVTEAEANVLLTLTEKIQVDVDDIEMTLNRVIELDVIYARATYGLSYGGTCPDLFLSENENGSLSAESYLSGSYTSKLSSNKTEWTLYLPKAYHPLLLQQHRQQLQKARNDVIYATAEGKIARQQYDMGWRNTKNPSSLDMQVTAREQVQPVPIDVFIPYKTRVLVITGPNTGGKTVCLKTIGLAAMMAKSGVHVLCAESVRIPWFDSVFADIGDEQSLTQSLSTFSGHLKQISDIQLQSTNQSLVLLDEVGAGTNPLEGAALGMSLLESFAESGALLTIATTHHGELKTLKYSNNAFENASMEFDEVKLKPTYKILSGVPGRSNAVNIAEKLGLPGVVVDNARNLYGAASMEIDEVIIDMERFKQNFQELLREARQYLRLSKNLYEDLVLARRRLTDHGTDQRYIKMQEVTEAAALARSNLHKKVRQLCASAEQPPRLPVADKSQHKQTSNHQHPTAGNSERARTKRSSSIEMNQMIKQSPDIVQKTVKRTELPRVGDMVHVHSLGKKLLVVRVESSKEEITVQAGNMKLKMKLSDVQI